MPKSRAEIKAQVMAELEAVVEQVLSQVEQGEGLTITGIEDKVLQARSQISQQLTGCLAAQASGPVVPGPRCAKCGQEMHYKGMKRRYVRTRSGEIRLERAYYHCSKCQQGSFPPG